MCVCVFVRASKRNPFVFGKTVLGCVSGLVAAVTFWAYQTKWWAQQLIDYMIANKVHVGGNFLIGPSSSSSSSTMSMLSSTIAYVVIWSQFKSRRSMGLRIFRFIRWHESTNSHAVRDRYSHTHSIHSKHIYCISCFAWIISHHPKEETTIEREKEKKKIKLTSQ